jgi:hypothetical protein
MPKIDRNQIAYNGKPIASLTRDELISALEELAGAIQGCADKNKECAKIIKINIGLESQGGRTS